MKTNYVMVDFENTQPESLDELPVGAFSIMVFVGAAQAKGRVPMKFSMSMQRHGTFAQYVQMTRSGPNAMDMHIAYFLGQLLEREPGASVYIVSRDKDFDPLIEFLGQHGGRCARVKSIAEIARQRVVAPRQAPVPAKPATQSPARAATPRARGGAPAKQAPPKPQPATRSTARPAPAAAIGKSVAADIDAIVKQLRAMSGKPGTRKKLAQTIGSYFKHHGGARSERETEQVIDELAQRGLIEQNGAKINYTLGQAA